jgi:hypothetical protein
MKKMILLLMSSLLIASLAGPSMAGDTVLTPDTVAIHADGKSVTDVATSVSIDAGGTYQTKVYTSNSGLHAYIDSSDPISVGDSDNWANETPISGNFFKASSPLPKTYTGILHIKGTQAGTVTVEIDTSQGRFIHPYSVKTVAVNVPEFPTLALPVAAIIGMVFIVSGRSKK